MDICINELRMAYNFKTERGVPMRKNLSKKLTAYITKNRYLLALFMGVLAGTFLPIVTERIILMCGGCIIRIISR